MPLGSIFQGLIPLAVLLAIALRLAIARPIGTRDRTAWARLSQAATLAIGVQLVHFLEELSQGFHYRYPELLGIEPWPIRFFATLNITCLVVWLLSVAALSRRTRAALFPLWFLGVAGVVNAVAHPLMALAEGRYFPGLWTSPLAGIVGLLLLRRLMALTGSESGGPDAVER